MAKGWNAGDNAFSISINMSARAVAGDNIEASAFSVLHNTVRDGVNQSINKNGINTIGANINAGGNQFTNLGAPTSGSQGLRVQDALQGFPVYVVDTEAAAASTSISVVPAMASDTSSQASLSGATLMIRVSATKPVVAPASMALNVANATAYTLTDARGNAIMPGAFVPGTPFPVYLSGSQAKASQPFPAVYKVIASASGIAASATLAQPSYTCELFKWGDQCGIRIQRTVSLDSPLQSLPQGIVLKDIVPGTMRPAAAKFATGVDFLELAGTIVPAIASIETDGDIYYRAIDGRDLSVNDKMYPGMLMWSIASAGT